MPLNRRAVVGIAVSVIVLFSFVLLPNLQFSIWGFDPSEKYDRYEICASESTCQSVVENIIPSDYDCEILSTTNSDGQTVWGAFCNLKTDSQLVEEDVDRYDGSYSSSYSGYGFSVTTTVFFENIQSEEYNSRYYVSDGFRQSYKCEADCTDGSGKWCTVKAYLYTYNPSDNSFPRGEELTQLDSLTTQDNVAVVKGTIKLSDYTPLSPQIVCDGGDYGEDGGYASKSQSVYWSTTYHSPEYECRSDSDCASTRRCVPLEVGSECQDITCPEGEIVDHTCVSTELPQLCSEAGITNIYECRDYLDDYASLLSGEIQEKVEAINKLENILENKEELIRKFNLTLQEYEIELQRLNATVQEQEEQISRLNQTRIEQMQTILEMEITVEEQRERLDDMNATIEELAQAIQEANETIEYQSQKIRELSRNVEEKSQLLDQFRAEDERQRELIKKVADSLEEQGLIVREFNQTLDEDAQILKNLSTSNEELATIIKGMKLKNEELSQLLLKVKEDNEQLAYLLREAREDNREMAKTIKDMKLTNEEMAEILSNMKLKNEELSEIVVELREETDEQQEIIDAYSRRLSDKEEEIQELKDDINRLIEEREERNRNIMIGSIVVGVLFLVGGYFYFRRVLRKPRRKKKR